MTVINGLLCAKEKQQHRPCNLPNPDLGLFSLLPDAQGVDYEEEQFAKRMKKKKRRLQ